MPTNVIMPALGMDQDTGTLVRWIKHEGDRVSQGEPIMEIETNKVVVEIEATASGVLSNVTAAEGDALPVGQVIAQIVEEGGPLTPALSPTRGERAQARAARPTSAASAPNPQPSTGVRSARTLASPKARRVAAERGLDLTALRGSGPDGAVLAADLPSAAPPQPSAPSVSRTWRVMAERMTTAWTTIPHFALVREVDASGLRDMHGRLAPAVSKQAGVPPTYTDLLVKLIATAIRRQPRINASWRDGTVEQQSEVNVGIAVANDDGLVVPVVHGADALSIGEIAAHRRDLVDRATAGKLTPADISGGTFTLSNLGMYGVDAFAAIVNPPQAAILAVGRMADRVIAVDSQPAVRPTMILTLSCDHRAVGGARAAQFLDELATLIEEPLALLA